MWDIFFQVQTSAVTDPWLNGIANDDPKSKQVLKFNKHHPTYASVRWTL